jgi:hypothetical protein
VSAQNVKSKPNHRQAAREQGKLAYRQGVALSENPFEEAGDRLAWTEGWIYQRTLCPTAQDTRRAADDPDCLAPWVGNDDGYNGYC